jgi:hypothetical protein
MIKQSYPLTVRPQLIDLNKDSVNFKLEFNVIAQNPENEFFAIVLTQDQLDSVDLNKIEMKNAKGKISGNITANNDKYKNYFLILKKSDQIPDFDVDVSINLEEIDPNLTTLNNPPDSSSIQDTSKSGNENLSIENQPSTACSTIPFYKKTWFWIMIFIIGALLVLFYYNRKNGLFSRFLTKKLSSPSKLLDTTQV